MTGYVHEMPGGAAWSAPVRAGRQVILTATGPRANATVLLWAADRLDRLNVPDTLKAQMSARIIPPMVLMSDRGQALVSVVGSTLDWHDCLAGIGQDVHVPPGTSYADDRNGWRRSTRSLLLLEMAKHGLGEPDLHGCVNFFSKVAIDPAAELAFVPDHCPAGATVTLRTEQDLLLLVATTPHPMDEEWAPAGIRIEVGPAGPVSADDPSVTFRDESARALEAARRSVA
ncbi:MAG TPA: DUF1989 domain-containing protein [Nocardioides sp.]|nr:DUF1989 domain-containing protein [Nocardioides sp.]